MFTPWNPKAIPLGPFALCYLPHAPNKDNTVKPAPDKSREQINKNKGKIEEN